MLKDNINVFIGSKWKRRIDNLHKLTSLGWSKFALSVLIAGIKQAELHAKNGDTGLNDFISDNSK